MNIIFSLSILFCKVSSLQENDIFQKHSYLGLGSQLIHSNEEVKLKTYQIDQFLLFNMKRGLSQFVPKDWFNLLLDTIEIWIDTRYNNQSKLIKPVLSEAYNHVSKKIEHDEDIQALLDGKQSHLTCFGCKQMMRDFNEHST